ncbi:GntR family transcriptional regulator [Nostoc sp. 3335mG]|nr:GntR family transcriptional regulator [Nostoc sp. 3335mG]
MPIAEQIYDNLRRTILEGVLVPGQRLPSSRDLAKQLGVARGTVGVAYDRLVDDELIASAGAAGTRVCPQPPVTVSEQDVGLSRPLGPFAHPYVGKPLPLKMGVPAHDAFPAKVWTRLRMQAVRADAMGHSAYADPLGEPSLRAQIASHLAVTRQVRCHPDQVIVTSGYRQGLMVALTGLYARGRKAWMENPGYPVGRRSLELAGLSVEPIDVDAEGLMVEQGTDRAPDAALALVTPGQHAPLGMTMSPARRQQLLDWAQKADAHVIEDDYLSELKIDGRAEPALASGDGADRVIHLGTFSKTIGPTLGLGYLIAPPALVNRLVEAAALTAPAPSRTTQLALTRFLGDGHFLRHLRQMKVLYAERRGLALQHLSALFDEVGMSSLALIGHLREGTNDVQLAQSALAGHLAPTPLSPWYADTRHARPGFIMGVTNIRPDNIDAIRDGIRKLIG